MAPIKPRFVATVTRRDPGTGASSQFTTEVIGRVAWCLLALLQAGRKGCTPITRPAPRWSDYIHKLRGQGINIATIEEPHEGSFAGYHARYQLLDEVTVDGGNLDQFLAGPEGHEFANCAFERRAA
jgi:hypothetical protein